MGFIQNRFITNFGLTERANMLETIHYLAKRKDEKPFLLFLPATYEDATNQEVMGNIVSNLRELQETNNCCIDQIVLGLDTADSKNKFHEVTEIFRAIPNSIVIWNNSPEMIELYETLEKNKDISLKGGKGRNLWTGLGYRFANKRSSSFILHDCDILPNYYSVAKVLGLVEPIVNPNYNFNFTKAYYSRLKTDEFGKKSMSGRVTRLLVAPLIEALKERYGANQRVREHLDAIQSFKYPLSGEFAMDDSVASVMPIQSDWGLEISSLNFICRQPYKIAQVDWSEYDHKHTDLFIEETISWKEFNKLYPHKVPKREWPKFVKQFHDIIPKKKKGGGLEQMAHEVAKTFFRDIYTMVGSKILDDYEFDRLLISFNRFAENAIQNYKIVSRKNAWEYDIETERKGAKIFRDAMIAAFTRFKSNPDSLKPLPPWETMDRKYRAQIRDIAKMYNPS